MKDFLFRVKVIKPIFQFNAELHHFEGQRTIAIQPKSNYLNWRRHLLFYIFFYSLNENKTKKKTVKQNKTH